MTTPSYESTYQPNRPTQYNTLDAADYFLAIGVAGRALALYWSIDIDKTGVYYNYAIQASEPIDFDAIRSRRNEGIQRCQELLGNA